MLRESDLYKERERKRTMAFGDVLMDEGKPQRSFLIAGLILGVPVTLMLFGLLANYLDRVNKDDGPTKEEMIRRESFEASPLQRKSVQEELEEHAKKKPATSTTIE